MSTQPRGTRAYAINSNNLMNSFSSATGGTRIDGVDVDTFDASAYVYGGEQTATVEYGTGTDIWNWIYLIVSITSHFEPGAGETQYSVGIIAYGH